MCNVFYSCTSYFSYKYFFLYKQYSQTTSNTGNKKEKDREILFKDNSSLGQRGKCEVSLI